jgi:hypothetical protein
LINCPFLNFYRKKRESRLSKKPGSGFKTGIHFTAVENNHYINRAEPGNLSFFYMSGKQLVE